MATLKKYWVVLRKTVTSFFDDNGFKLSASLSYYTIFSLGPVMIIVISLSGIFFGREAAQGKIYEQVSGLIGSDAALQLQQIIRNVEFSQYKTTGIIIGVIMLLIGASTVFTEIQDSINHIWSVKAKPKKGWMKLVRNRLLSFSLIVAIGFISLVALVINAALDALSGRLMKLFPDTMVVLAYILNMVLLLIVITSLFLVVFKVLPDAIIRWRDVIQGAVFTAILFMGGKFLISYYITHSSISTTYGAATSIVIILVWVYYSAVILYLGAEFTKNYAITTGSGIKPRDTAVFIIKKEAKEVPPSYLET